jgi:hypothetical protein
MAYPQDLFLKYKNKGVLIDTNLLLLFVVGTYDINRISTSSRTNQFTAEDFLLLRAIVNFFQVRTTTPNILTEVDNLVRQIFRRAEHEAVAITMRETIDAQFEIYVPSTNAANSELYGALGIADCSTMMCPPDKLILTDDFPLSNRLSSMGRDVLNINHIRKFEM